MASNEILQSWKQVLIAAGHTPRLEGDGTLWLDYDRADYHMDTICTACHERWCIYCVDIESNADLIEPCEVNNAAISQQQDSANKASQSDYP